MTRHRPVLIAIVALLLVWLYWQNSRRSLVSEIADCVDTAMFDFPAETLPSVLVRSCYSNRRDRADDERIYDW